MPLQPLPTHGKLCVRCGRPREYDKESNICGTCADDLRDEEDQQRLEGEHELKTPHTGFTDAF